ncbi:hypothetical protein PDQ29_27805 [Bacillus cereus]|nr:hypothetical protein [Bacillus cereus]
MGKFDNNPFSSAENEIVKNEGKGKIIVSQTIGANIPQGKETKKQMSLMFTPSDKEKARRIAERHNMSVSELFSYLLAQVDEEQ